MITPRHRQPSHGASLSHAKLNCWRARIYVAGRNIHLGYFGTAEEARAAHAVAVKQHLGDGYLRSKEGSVCSRRNRAVPRTLPAVHLDRSHTRRLGPLGPCGKSSWFPAGVPFMKPLALLDAMTDPNLYGRHFRDPSWNAWRGFVAALEGSKLSQGPVSHVSGAYGPLCGA